eukprot:gi/632936187/ref/XP_007892820.1/ PREDICTED: G-protein coupled receptor 183-like [Callorhinchus milii]
MALEFSTVATANDSNNSTCELYGHRKTVTVLISLLYSILCITGIPGNILAFYIVLYNKSKLNSTMIYLINLTAADLLFTLSLPARIVYYSYGFYWSLRELIYSCISLKLYQMRKQNLSGGTSNRAQNYRSQIVVLAVLVVFLVCFTPYHIGLTQHVVKMLTEEPICKTRQDFQSNETGKHIPEELEEICFQGTESVEEHNPKGFVQNKLFL